jgi:transposase
MRPGQPGTGWRARWRPRGSAASWAAPGKIERPSQDRVKTDQRDAERVLRLLMIDGLHAVRVPSSEEEALRDLIRAREDLRGDLMCARQRLSKLLLRHDVRYEDTASAWTARHLEAAIARLVPGSPWAQTVAGLRCLRGIDTLAAVGLCAEVGDFERFERPARLMSYLGLVPSENSSGETRHQGAITKTGSRHARRLLAPAADIRCTALDRR